MRNWTAEGIPDAGVRLWNEKRFLVIPRPEGSNAGRAGVDLDSLPSNFVKIQVRKV